LVEAENLGVKSDFSDEIKATANTTITNAGSVGDVFVLNFLDLNNENINVCTYTKTATDTTVTILASSIVANINTNSLKNGFTASNVAGVITLTAKAGLGIYANIGSPLSILITGGILATITSQFSGGVASQLAVFNYHISEYFRLQPKGNLFLGFFPIPTAWDFNEINLIQSFADGKIRQLGIYKPQSVYAVADLTTIQNIAKPLDDQKQPLSVLFAPDLTSVNLTSLTDLQAYSNNKVSVVIGQDGANKGNALYKATGKSISCLGTLLGSVSLANVHEDIAWVGKFNLSNGLELENVAFSNGIAIKDVSVNLLDSLNDKRYIFLRKFPNKVGTYFNDSHTAISQSSDYAYIENNRVIDKAIRGVYEALLPSLNSPLTLKATGELSNATVEFLESQAVIVTDDMIRKGEASEISVSINPLQNVASTSKVLITITIVPIGVARNINVTIGFKTSI
jgi:Protein of unknown function (DUF2586)